MDIPIGIEPMVLHLLDRTTQLSGSRVIGNVVEDQEEKSGFRVTGEGSNF
jgi:hypothetical protein